MIEGYIAIDLGAESGRAVVGTLADGKVSLEEVHRFPHEILQLPTGLHWDVTGLWREICSGLRQAAQWAAENGVDIVSVGVDTWGVDWGLIGKSGELIGLPHAYRDPRNDAAYERAVKQLGVEAIYQKTGIQLMSINTLYSLYAQWLASSEVIHAAERLLFMPDLFHYWLTGIASIEATIASTSQMLDCQTGDWAHELIGQLGMPTDFLGPITQPGTTLGPLRPELAEFTGLAPETTVVLPGSHDTASAVAAVPASADSNWCYCSSGTWSLFGAELEEPCATAAAQSAMFTNELGVGGRIRFLKNITGLWIVQECRRDLARQGSELNYTELTEQAGSAESFRTLIDPNHTGFQTPRDMLQKICDFASGTEQPTPETPGQFIRCCLESIALLYRRTFGQLQQVLNRQFEVIHIVGGGGQNQLLNQMTADTTEREVCIGPFEATAVGNVLVQALAAGRIADLDELRTIVANSHDLQTYRPENSADWVTAEKRFAEQLGR